jgi:HEAT repeat protein
MQKDVKPDETLSSEIQDVMKFLIAAIRIVRIYPPNNPLYAQSIKKSYEVLADYLETSPDYCVGVQKTYFTYERTPVGKDSQVNRPIAQDLFAKGIREVVFSTEIAEAELLALCRGLALSPEELAMRSGISTILWEKGSTHIKVTEAGLDEVITTKTEGGWENTKDPGDVTDASGVFKAKKQVSFTGKTLVLGDVKTDPEGFGASMVAFAMRTRAEHESVEDRLFNLYQQAGHKVRKDHGHESDVMFEGLAKSILALEPPYREGLIAGKLYGDLDAEIAGAEEADTERQLPSALHEIQTGRFSNAWTVQQVVTLLKRTASKKITPATPPPSPTELQAVPIPGDLIEIAHSLEKEDPEQIEALKAISGAGMESDIIEAAVRTLISLIPLVKNPLRAGAAEKELGLFSGIVRQLEDLLSYLLKNNNYSLATIIIKGLHMPVDPEFKPRMAEALKKTATKPIVKATITDMRRHPKGSPEYQSAYAYLSTLDQKATEALLDLLAEEDDRETRIYLLDLMKDFGKNQIVLLGENLADKRWYVVRNIVTILGESKTDQAIALLRKAADHKDIRIRQEVIKALISTGGKKAAGVLAKFLRDQDASIQLTAIGAFAELPGVGAEEAKPLVDFLEGRSLKKKDHEFTLAAIKTLGKVGGRDAVVFLEGYTRIRWWRSRQLQTERRAASLRSIEEIKGRRGDVGRAKR